MYLIVGLGNPGKQYEQTRHNLGFRVLDLLAGKQHWQTKPGYAQFIKLDDVLLAKPETFMNRSGKAIKDIWPRFPGSELVVVHDDLDFPLGTISIQKNISAAGHNGVQSIVDELGTKDFTRVRLGIDNPETRGSLSGDDYVLQKFTEKEEEIVKEILERAKNAVGMIQTDGLDVAQSRFNG